MIPPGLFETRRIAPGVVIEGKEITSLVVGTTVHVFGCLVTVGRNICSGVAYRDFAVSTVSKVLPHIASDRFDIRGCSGGCRRFINNLVAGEESQGVGVWCKCVNGSEYALKINIVVRWRRIDSIDRVKRTVNVEDKVNASCGKSVHAGVMVDRIVDRVDSDRVDAQLGELCDISLASRKVGNRIFEV